MNDDEFKDLIVNGNLSFTRRIEINIGGIGDVSILCDLLGKKEPARGDGEQSKRLGLS